jgi:hypothetical protein
MKPYCGVDVETHFFLPQHYLEVSGQLHAPAALLPGTAPGTHWIGGWMGPRTGQDDVEKTKFMTLPGLELRPSFVQPVASRYTDCYIPGHAN